MKIFTNSFTQFESLLAPLFDRLPQVSLKTKNTIMQYFPVVILVFGIINTFQGIVSLIFKILRVLLTSPELLDGRSLFSTLVTVSVGLMLIKSYTYLKNEKHVGWQYVFGVTLFVGIINLFTNPLSCIQSFLFLYILFAIRVHCSK